MTVCGDDREAQVKGKGVNIIIITSMFCGCHRVTVKLPLNGNNYVAVCSAVKWNVTFCGHVAETCD